MKRTDKKTDTKKIASICGLSALSLAVLAGAYFLTREPTEEFVPSSIQTDTATDTWKENAGTDVQRPEDLPDGPIQVEGTAENKGLVIEEPGQVFAKGYEKYLWQSYNKYSHEDTEILIEVSPKYVEVWDTSDEGYAFQLFIDFEKKSVEVKQYDKK